MKTASFSVTLIILVLIGILIFSIVALSGCGNMQMISTTYSFEYAIIGLPNGEVIEGKVQSWMDFEDGDQIQVKIDGKTYLVHNEDIVLISE